MIYTSTAKSLRISGGAFSLQNSQVSFRNTANANQVVAIVNGQEITLDLTGGPFTGSNANYNVTIEFLNQSTNAQVELSKFLITNTLTGETLSSYAATGLATNPAQVAVLTGTGTYTGAAKLEVVHDTGASINYGYGAGTATINANFGTGVVFGTMAISDDGGSSAGYALSPTTILIDPTVITGNGFSTTLSIAAADLAMDVINTSDLDGTFFGVNAANVGGTFSVQGISNDTFSSAYITGGFIGQ